MRKHEGIDLSLSFSKIPQECSSKALIDFRDRTSLHAKLRTSFAGLSTGLVVGVLVLVILLVAASAFFLIQPHNQASSSTMNTSSTLASTSTSTSFSGNLLMEFAFPGVLIASPDLEMNYTVTLSGVPNNLTLNAIAPQGLSAEFSPDNVTLGSTTLQIGTSESAGSYQVILEATGNGFLYNQTVSVQVIKYLVVTIGTTFVPENLTVTAGANVTWLRLNGPLSAYDNGDHDIDFLSGASAVSPTLAQYQSWSYTFPQAGDYKYFCKFHPFMMGEIVVVSG